MTGFILTPATLEDATDLAADMRPEDVEELFVLTGETPEVACEWSVRHSDDVWAARSETGRMLALFGVAPVAVLGGVGAVWLLGTPGLAGHTRAMLRGSPSWLAKWFTRYDKLTNVVWEGNRPSVRYLRGLGFSFSERKTMPVSRAGYYVFAMTKKDFTHV